MRIRGIAPSCVLLLGLTTACAPNVKGEYICSGGMLDSIVLESGEKATVSATNVIGIKQTRMGTYTVTDDRVTITMDMQPHDFVLKGNTLDGGILGKCSMH